VHEERIVKRMGLENRILEGKLQVATGPINNWSSLRPAELLVKKERKDEYRSC
jgi:hypothetical protein